MSDDLGKKIQQIAGLLGQDSVPDNVKELIEVLATSMAKKEGGPAKNSPAEEDADSDAGTAEPVPPAEEAPEKKTDKSAAGELLNNPELLSTARNALSRINAGNDPRINLLYAIKPFMNGRRQKKIGSCIQLLQVAGLSRLLNEHDSNPR
jgi:hypothetical protein